MDVRRVCPVCHATLAPEPVERFAAYALQHCPSCDLQLWWPATPGDAAWYDASDHYLAAPVVDWLGWYHRWGLEHLPAGAETLLDLGCGDGRFVYAAAKRGVDAVGIDHSRRMVELGNARYGGSRLTSIAVEEFSSAGRRFDVVSMFEVIEHVPDPLALVRTATSVVVPGGTLIVSTPNRLGRPRPPLALDRPPHHLTRWSPGSLRAVLVAGGFEVTTMGFSPGAVGIKGFLLDRVRFGVLVRVLRRRALARAEIPPQAHDQDVRRAIWTKDRLAELVGSAASPLVGRWFRGGAMVAIARQVV